MRGRAPSLPAVRRPLEAAAFAVLGALLLLTQLGYSFETGDQLQYLLLPYREIDPEFLPGDWFTWQTTHYHESYAWIVRALHGIAGDAGLPWAVFACHLVVLAALAGSVLAWSRAWGFGPLAAGTALVVMAVIRQTAIAGATLNHGQLLPADMALPPLLFAFAAWLSRRPLVAGLALGLSGLLHPNFAVLGPLVLFPLAVLDVVRERAVKPLFLLTASYAVLAAPTLVIIVRSFLTTDTAPEAMRIFFTARAPHHYDLAAMPFDDFAWPALLFVAGLPAWRLGSWSAGSSHNRWLFGALFVALTLALAGSLIGSLPMVRLFLWRLSVPFCIGLLFVATDVARRIVAGREPGSLAWLVACVAVGATFVRSDLADVAPLGVPAGASMLVALAPLAAAGSLIGPARSQRLWLVVAMSLVPTAWSIGVAATPLSVERRRDRDVDAGVRGPRLSPIHIHPEERKWMTRVRNETPRGARFLIPPSLGDFRLRARRAVYVDWKCAPMKGDELLEWRRRMLVALGVSELPGAGYALRERAADIYAARDLADLEQIARRERLHYVVGDKHAIAPPGLRRGIAGARWRVYRVLSEMDKALRIRALERQQRVVEPLP